MNPAFNLHLTDGALIKLTHQAICDLRRTAEFIGALTRAGASARASRNAVVCIAHSESADYKPLLKLAVATHGPGIFRRYRFKSFGAPTSPASSSGLNGSTVAVTIYEHRPVQRQPPTFNPSPK